MHTHTHTHTHRHIQTHTKIKRVVKKKMRLPDRLIPLKNADKFFHERWETDRNRLDIPHPFRGVLLGPPNCGKSTTAKNILIRAQPPCEAVTVIHCDPEHTREYLDLGNHRDPWGFSLMGMAVADQGQSPEFVSRVTRN